jgi:5-methylcytosine-specific restriction endonuclease McrA
MKALALLLILALPADAAKRCQTCARDSRGRIKRSYRAKHQFRASHPCPSTGKIGGRCPEVVDHIVPLCRGGADSPANMQYQTRADAKAKDKTECRQ